MKLAVQCALPAIKCIKTGGASEPMEGVLEGSGQDGSARASAQSMDEDMSPRAPGSGDGTETQGLTSMTNLVRQDWAETAAPEAAAAEEGRRKAEAPMDAAPEAGEEAVAATAREGSGVGRRSWRSRTEDTGTEEQEVAMPTLVFGLTRSNPN